MLRRLVPVLVMLACATGPIACDDDSASDGVASGSVGGSLDFKGKDLVFSRVFQNSPAARAGIRPGDKVLKINGNSTSAMTMDAAKTAFRGAIGSTLTVVYATGSGDAHEVTLTREVLKARVPIGPTAPVVAVPPTAPGAAPAPAAAPAVAPPIAPVAVPAVAAPAPAAPPPAAAPPAAK